MNEIKQNTSQVTYLFLEDSNGDPVTGASNPTVYYSKAGGASTQLTEPTFSELDATNFPGVYMLTIPASLTDTLGELVISVSAAGTEKWVGKYQVVANTVKDAMDRLGVPVGASVSEDVAAAVMAISDLPTAAEIADAVHDEPAADHNTEGTFGNKINILSTGGVDTEELAALVADKINDAMVGGGTMPFTYTVTRADNGLPIADVLVWVTTDQAGTNIVAAGRTDDFGVVQPQFMLDSGTYYFRQDKAGYKFTNPQVVVVSAEQTSAGTIGTLIDVQQIPIGPAVKTFTRNNEDFSKYPQETYPIAFDFAKALSADDYVVQVSVKAYDETQEVTDTIINGTSASGQAAIAIVQGGTANTSYKLLCKITSFKGLVREMKIRMDVKPE